jgi:hypothetical protein
MPLNCLHLLWNNNYSSERPLLVPDIALAVSNPLDVFDEAVGAIARGDPIGLEVLLRHADVRTYLSCICMRARGTCSIV